jgi:acyl-CoA thioesterase YciA
MNSIPAGELTIQVLAMPADTNPSGDIFGGWIMSQMDIAGGVFCRQIIKARVVTVAVNSIAFRKPVFMGDTLSCYVLLKQTGSTSITVHIEAWARMGLEQTDMVKVTEGDFVYVKINEKREPEKIGD